jgi:Trk K+ transport system NAD-binding subunit/Kef-type K+ transport system membrane component KefB
VLDLVSTEAVQSLTFIDDIALAFIAFTAGNELFIKEIRPRLVGISFITLGIVLVGGVVTAYSFLLLADFVPFMANLDATTRIAIMIASLAVIISLSPAATIAVIGELRAKGPLTKTAIGVSVVADVVVIIAFAICISIADTLLSGEAFELLTLILLASELAVSVLLGWLFSKLLKLVLRLRLHQLIKMTVILASGYGVFALSHWVATLTKELLHHSFHIESLLTCLIATFIVTNYSPYRTELTHILETAAPAIYLAFFMLTGIALELDVLWSVWLIALAFVLIRGVSVMVGAFLGGVAAREPMRRNIVGWMPYITQAGVGLGLAKSLSTMSPDWGLDLASLLIGIIVFNQLIGPPLFKFALDYLGETHVKGDTAEFDGVQDVVIMGVEDQSLALAQELLQKGWKVKLVEVEESVRLDELEEREDHVFLIGKLSPRTMTKLDMKNADVLVAMFNDDDLNYAACEMAFEYFGTPHLIVRINDSSAENILRFDELGVRIINPQTAMVSLLNQFVRSPAATSLLLGLQDGQVVEDVRVRSNEVDGKMLRDLKLPSDVLILSLRRAGQLLVTHGYTKIALNDELSVVGSPESVQKVRMLFG